MSYDLPFCKALSKIDLIVESSVDWEKVAMLIKERSRRKIFFMIQLVTISKAILGGWQRIEK
jgi:hypothetical protein